MRTEEIRYSPFKLHGEYLVVIQLEPVVNLRQALSHSPSYNIYIGNNTKRIFQRTTLPTFIQLKLAMINSIPKEDWNIEQYENYLFEVDCYAHRKNFTKNPEFKNIGWCMSDSIYVIVMSEDELSELKGISIDPRKESQTESQTHTQRT